MLRKIFLLVVLLLSICSIEAQNNKSEFKKTEIDLKTDNVIEVFQDKDNNDISVYSNYMGIKEIKTGPNKGERTGDYREGIVFNDGSKIEFSEDEIYLNSAGDRIYTTKSDLNTLHQEIIIYRIVNKKLTEINRSSFKIRYTDTFSPLSNNQFFLWTNNYEAQGDTIKLFDKGLRLVKTYIPSENGFMEYAYDANDKYLCLVSTFETAIGEKKYKISIFDLTNNLALVESTVDGEIKPVRTFVGLKSFVVLCSDRIISIDMNGNVRWSKNMIASMAPFSIVLNEAHNKLFTISDRSVLCLNLNDGTEIWRVPLNKLNPNYDKHSEIKHVFYSGYLPLDFKILDNYNTLGIITAKLDSYEKEQTDRYSDKILSIINFNGKIIKNISLETNLKSTQPSDVTNVNNNRANPCRIINSDKGFGILQKGSITRYEK